MRVAVCGLGKVGLPLLEFLRSKGIESPGYDICSSKSQCSLEQTVKSSDACIFMVHTPSLPDGSFSNQYLENALRAFKAFAPPGYLYIIGSTVVPGSCERFMEIVGNTLCYKPEFIRLARIEEDLRSQPYVLIGEGTYSAGTRCEELYKRLTNAPVFRMGLVEAELAKITLNCALTMKISLANQLYLVAKRMGADADKIMQVVGADPRIGPQYLKPGEPYGGPCLPRDNAMFAYFAKSVGVEAHLSIAADKINEAMK
jgi:UDPglucose 6-dehydrogenase